MKSKEDRRRHFDAIAPQRDEWKRRSSYYYEDLESFVASLVPTGRSVIEIGCGTGDLLHRLSSPRGLGIDFSPEMVRIARKKYPADHWPNLEFQVDDVEDLSTDEKFDYIVMSDVIGELWDVWAAFRNLRKVAHEDSRIIITTFNGIWEPALRLGQALGMKIPQDWQNWLSPYDVENLLNLNGMEILRRGYRLLLPEKVPFLSTFFNRYLVRLPLIGKLGLASYVVAKMKPEQPSREARYSVSVVVPCRNERGNIRETVERIPDMGLHTEILFVDGCSTDGTVEAINECIERFVGEKDIKLLHQLPPQSEEVLKKDKMLKLGKGDAVRKGFEAASGEILMILDADLTVLPEELPKFYLALAEGCGDFANGSRLVYPMEAEAMRFLNKAGNKFFSLLFSWLLEQRIKDTLCGTKVIFKEDYQRVAAEKDYFGDFDPFGDFDLLFGAARQNLKIVEVPVRYHRRTYGNVKIERFKHGWLLLKMSAIAMMKLKFT